MSTAPHYLLLSEAQTGESNRASSWRFVLERMDGSGRIEVADDEPGVRGERLQLLSVVRGLEALEQPSRVTLITPSRFVGRGIRSGIGIWRENQWQWERFGEMSPVKHADLWRRIDRAMNFHRIDCRVWNFENLSLEPVPQSTPPATRDRTRRLPERNKFQVPSWAEIAHAVACRINPWRSNNAYGYA